jgi:adenylate cyclase
MGITPQQTTRSARLHPRRWSIAVKLSSALVAASLLPMLVVSWYNLHDGIDAVAAGEARKLEQLASSTSGRIDQLIKDTRHTVSYFTWSENVIRLATAPDDSLRVLVTDTMSRLMAANDDIELFLVLDANGKVLASSRPQDVGRDLAFRDYFKYAIRGENFVSDIEIGVLNNHPGMYFSDPIRSQSGRVAGVAVLKLSGNAVNVIMEESRNRDASLDSFLVDDNGIIVYHRDPRALFHSMRPLPDDVHKQVIAEKRFGPQRESIPSLDLKPLADRMLTAKQPGHAAYFSPLGNRQEVAGFAPLAEQNWHVAVATSEDVYSQPIRQLFRNALNSAAFVGVIFAVLAFLLARTFTRPLKALTESAVAVENGDLEHARVQVMTQDELGAFAQTFNAMVEGIKARQRERDIFGRVVSPEVREKLLTGEIKLGGENLRVSVLFSDIRGFSSISEKLSPNDVVMLLNDYLTEMTEAVRPWGGYVNNFIGDAMVVVFGAPEAQAGNELNAIRAALAMKERLAALNRRRHDMGDPPIETGIGISTGKVVAGQIGSLERFMYTVIGDAVNVAARLESLTKKFDGNPILVNAMTCEACLREESNIRFVDQGMQRLKGREELVHVFAVYPEEAGEAPPAQRLASVHELR